MIQKTVCCKGSYQVSGKRKEIAVSVCPAHRTARRCNPDPEPRSRLSLTPCGSLIWGGARQRFQVHKPNFVFSVWTAAAGLSSVIQPAAFCQKKEKKRKKGRKKERKKERKKGKKKKQRKRKEKSDWGSTSGSPQAFIFQLGCVFYGLAQRTKLGHSIRFNGIGHGIAAGSGKHKRENRRGGEGGGETKGRGDRGGDRECGERGETHREGDRQTQRDRERETETDS